MSQNQSNSTERITSAGAWDLRHPGLVMKGANGEEIHEFTGMWPLKPDADLVEMQNALTREAPFWAGPGRTPPHRSSIIRPRCPDCDNQCLP